MYQFTHLTTEDDGVELYYSEEDLREAALTYTLEIIKEDGIESLLIDLNGNNSETNINIASILMGEKNDFFYDILKTKEEVVNIAELAAIYKYREGSL